MIAATQAIGAGIGVAVLAWSLQGVAALPDGARLYSRHCAVCHGSEGQGGVGVPLALPDFQSAVSNRYLATTIREGRPGRVMPAFTSFSDEQIDVIVAHIRSWSKGSPPAYSAERVAGDPVRGHSLYLEHCADCHGESGQGGHGTGKTFSRRRGSSIMAPALNNAGFLSSASDAMIRKTLIEGREDTPMQAFPEEGLSGKDIDDVVSFVRSFETVALSASTREAEPAILVAESPYAFQETIENVRRAVIGKNFRLIREQYLEGGLMPVGRENRNQVIIYFCNFKFLYDALGLDPRVGLFLPCRVTVVERDGIVKVMTVNPRRLGLLFNNNELDDACEEMQSVYNDIIEEATF